MQRAPLLLVPLLLLACGPSDGIVGIEPLGAAASNPAAFFDDFATDTGRWEDSTPVPGASVRFAAAEPTASDGKVLRLVLPGQQGLAGQDFVGPDSATQLSTLQRFHFGTYRTRMAFGSCATNEEAVMAFLGYFSDGRDADGDGLTDDLEIDIQVACGTPRRAYLTVFTDDEPTPGRERFQKSGRVVDFETGERFDTQAIDSDRFFSAGVEADALISEAFEPGQPFELGFEWHAESIRFFLQLQGAERDLWTLTGAERIPQLPVHIMYNTWHPDSHWYPDSSAADYPSTDVVTSVDWVSFTPE